VRVRGVGLGVFGIALAVVLAGAGVNCGSDDNSTGDDSGAAFDTYVEGPYLCDFFTEVGAPCPQASPILCFALCTDGGCYCEQGPSGPVWACTTDLSCLPDGGPLDDSGSNPPVDGAQGGDDGNVDSGEDAAVDAGTDAEADASTDSGEDAQADAADAGDASALDSATE
jgi:hypothetical protein